MSSEGSVTATKRDVVWAFAIVAALVALDQVTKQYVHATLAHSGAVTVVDGYFDLFYSRNPGAFFSLGAELNPYVRRIGFIVVSTLAVGLIGRLFYQTARDQTRMRAALVLFLAGAIGNLIDRIASGEVIDFLHIHVRDAFHWATFNVADIYITAGAALMVLDMIQGSGRVPKSGDELSRKTG